MKEFQTREKDTIKSVGDNFRGTAKINLKNLNISAQTGDLNPANVARLKIILAQSCLRLQAGHRIPGILSQSLFDSLLQKSQVEQGALYSFDNPPKLELPVGLQIQCLHGRHRIAAALQILTPGDDWWTIDLYLDSLSDEAKTLLCEDYSNALNFSDGEIFCKVRQNQEDQNIFGEKRWWSYLSKSKRKNLRRLFLKPSIMRALDELRCATGLWSGFRLGDIHTLLALRCDEEICHYLAHIQTVWELITNRHMSLIDRRTVNNLELKAPGSSYDDCAEVLLALDKQIIFSKAETELRSIIREKLTLVYGLIPSLHTFFEDVKFIRPCAKLLRSLVDPPAQGSLHVMLRRLYSNPSPGNIIIQCSEQEWNTYPTSLSEDDVFYLAYQQLWLLLYDDFLLSGQKLPRKRRIARSPLNLSQMHLYRMTRIYHPSNLRQGQALNQVTGSNPRWRKFSSTVIKLIKKS